MQIYSMNPMLGKLVRTRSPTPLVPALPRANHAFVIHVVTLSYSAVMCSIPVNTLGC